MREHKHTTTCVCRSEDNLLELVLSFIRWVQEIKLRLSVLVTKSLSHLSSPNLQLLIPCLDLLGARVTSMWHYVWFYVVVVTPNQDSRSLAYTLPNEPARPLHSQLGCLSQHGRVLGIVFLPHWDHFYFLTHSPDDNSSGLC